MKTEQLQWTVTQNWNTSNIQLTNAQLVLVFAGIDIIEDCQYYSNLHSAYPHADIVLVSTSGEIHGTELFDNTASATAIYFENTPIRISTKENTAGKDAEQIGVDITNELLEDNLKHILLFSEGGHMNGDHLIAGISKNLPKHIAVTGGLAGDSARFSKTMMGLNTNLSENLVVAIGLYGEHIEVGFGSNDGWDLFGPLRLVTKAEENVLYTLDDTNALESEKEKCWQAGMNEYITKPYNPDLLKEKIILLIQNNSKSQGQQTENISLENLSELMNGSKEQMIRMTKVFLDQIEKHFNEIKVALHSNDLEQITTITHKLKSSFKLFGLNKTGVLLERIEQRAKLLSQQELHSELHIILNMQPRLTYLVQKELNQLILSNTLS